MSVVEDLTGISEKRAAAQAESDAIKNAPIEERKRLIDEQLRARTMERNQRGTGIRPISAGAASLMTPSVPTMLAPVGGERINPRPTPITQQRPRQFGPAKTLLGQ